MGEVVAGATGAETGPRVGLPVGERVGDTIGTTTGAMVGACVGVDEVGVSVGIGDGGAISGGGPAIDWRTVGRGVTGSSFLDAGHTPHSSP